MMQRVRKALLPGQAPVAWATPFLPVIAAILIATFEGHQASGAASWASFAGRFAIAAITAIPLFIAHFRISQAFQPISLILWILAFVAYPVTAILLMDGSLPLAARHWLMAAIFSMVALLPKFGSPGGAVAFVRRLPVTLDGAFITLLTIWTVASTSLFGSTPDAVNNQPLRVWFDAGRLLSAPLEFASYALQFSAIAFLIFGFYWICRNILVRNILRTQGWVAMAFASLIFNMLYSPLACSLILQLPLNPPHWSVLPSENHNPFDPVNYGVTLILWAVIMPVILAGERLLAERSDAIVRQEHARAELYVLQQQINPHFLFNSLNTLYAVCLKDSPASARLVVKLSELLQYTVYQGRNDLVSLDEEIAYLQNYIDLQLLRFASRCHVTFNPPENSGHYQIPPLLLIMLVENAFKHGVEPQDATSEITIDMAIEKNRLYFKCVNAPLPLKPASTNAGLGLDNMRRRLELMPDKRYLFSSQRHGNAWQAVFELDLLPC